MSTRTSCKISTGTSKPPSYPTYRQEKHEKTLKDRLATINNDKKKIQKTIAKLEKYKFEALDTTYAKVNVYVPTFFNPQRIW